ncbi:MAG TPA: PA14 domain-containing protein [Anaerolineae bacterium]|nr:PA14 domain-containing protein [Anaerolineae bacterium]
MEARLRGGVIIRRFSYLLCGFLAVALAVAAQWCLGHSQTVAAGLLYLGAACLAIYGLRRRAGLPTPSDWGERAVRRRRVRYLGVALVGLAGLLGVFSLHRFASPTGSSTGWLLYGGSIVVLLAGARLLDGGRGRVPGEPSGTRGELCLLLGILALGALVRFWGLETLPYGTWYDEAENGLVALRILEEPGYLPVYEPRVNSAGHYLLLLAGSLRLLGGSTLALRVVSVLVGIAAVAAGYLVGRELFGRRWGLVLAFLLAVCRWSINFSRIGMYNIATPLFELVALGFLLRGLRRRRYADFALSGIGLGLGTVFYVGFLAFPLVLVAFLVHTALAERNLLRHSWRGLLILICALVLTAAPVAQYAQRQGEEFWERTAKTSVFRGKTFEQALPVIGGSVVKYLQMFNYSGDRYGRHNLPREPMLDPVSGALMVLGAALCLWRWRRPRSLLLLTWLMVMLLPGVLSLEWEAPQALRTIGSLPAACLLAVVPLHGLGKEWHRVFGRRRALLFPLFVALLLGVIGWSNLHTYFVLQARSYESWRDFSTAETITARLMAQLDDGVDLYVISYYYDHPVVRFLAPQVSGYRRIETHDDLPLPQSVGQEVVMILDGGSTYLFEEAQRYYPRGTFEEYGSPFGGPAVVYVIRLSPQEVSSIQGLIGQYRPGDDWKAAPALTRQETQLCFEWSDGVPLVTPFLAEWEGVLRAPEYGTYRLVLRSPGSAEMHLDGSPLLRGEGESWAQVVLAEGNHALRIAAAGVEGHFELAWQPPGGEEQVVPPWALYVPPVPPNGLLGRYYPNGEWEAPLAFARIDERLGVYYHIAPLPTPYTIEWEGQLLIPESGKYVFALQSIDDSVLYIDGEEVVTSRQRDEYDQAGLDLEAGSHDLRLRYAARTHHMHVDLYWTPPGGRREIIPPEVLLPPKGSWQLLSPGTGGE